jgi:N-methylhydantoinase A
VTDAHVWLGHLPADGFLGGEVLLDRAGVEGPLRTLADRVGLTPEEAARGVLEVADTAMERALRVISVERGYDPAGFTVVAFGGAGGLHVAELTRRLGAARALVPPDPGLLSAYGMLASPVSREASRTLLVASDQPDAGARMDRALDELEAAARHELTGGRSGGDGPESGALRALRHVDARYRGQSFELRVPRDGWVESFHRMHEERYGYRRDATPVEAVTVRVEVQAPAPEVSPRALDPADGPPPTRPVALHQPVASGASAELPGGAPRGGPSQARAVWRHDLRAGHELTGPAIVQEYSGTTWVPPEWRLTVHPTGCLLLESTSEG